MLSGSASDARSCYVLLQGALSCVSGDMLTMIRKLISLDVVRVDVQVVRSGRAARHDEFRHRQFGRRVHILALPAGMHH